MLIKFKVGDRVKRNDYLTGVAWNLRLKEIGKTNDSVFVVEAVINSTAMRLQGVPCLSGWNPDFYVKVGGSTLEELFDDEE